MTNLACSAARRAVRPAGSDGQGPAPPPPAGGAEGVFRVATEEPNVYLDLASSVGRYGAFASAVALAGAGELLYGSDMPWMCASYQIGRVLLAPVPDEARRLVLGETLGALLATRCPA